jgi:hypothetical protein
MGKGEKGRNYAKRTTKKAASHPRGPNGKADGETEVVTTTGARDNFHGASDTIGGMSGTPRRHWFQFSLAIMFVVVTMTALGIGV